MLIWINALSNRTFKILRATSFYTMKKIILSQHTSLDGFVAGRAGEMDWITFDSDLFDMVGTITESADTALYGRITYEMMENYWPTAGDNPAATKHEREHSQWYKRVHKVVISKSLAGRSVPDTTFIGDNISERIAALKQQPGKNILIFGSPSVAHTLMQHNLIDEYWLFVNPVILGKGIPLFPNLSQRIPLTCVSVKQFPYGVVAMHYLKKE